VPNWVAFTEEYDELSWTIVEAQNTEHAAVTAAQVMGLQNGEVYVAEIAGPVVRHTLERMPGPWRVIKTEAGKPSAP